MCSGPKQNDSPFSITAVAGWPPRRGLLSFSAPRTTRTAPHETSWSCHPVSSSGPQQMSQTSTYSSRWTDSKCRRPVSISAAWSQSSGSSARLSTRERSSCLSNMRAGSVSHLIEYLLSMQETNWVGGEQCVRDGVSEPRPRRRRVRTVRAVDDDVHAKHADGGVDRPCPIRGRFNEHIAVDRAAASAAGRAPLTVERSKAAEDGEADSEPWVSGAPMLSEREPRLVHLLDIGHQRRPPGGGAFEGGCSAGMDQERSPATFQDVQQWTAPLVPGGIQQSRRGELKPDAASLEHALQRPRIDLAQAGRCPDAEGSG